MTYECCFYKFLSSYHLMGKRVSPNTWGQPYFSSLSIWILLPYKHASLHIITNTLDAEFHKIDKITVFNKIEKLKITLYDYIQWILNQTETCLFQVPKFLSLPKAQSIRLLIVPFPYFSFLYCLINNLPIRLWSRLSLCSLLLCTKAYQNTKTHLEKCNEQKSMAREYIASQKSKLHVISHSMARSRIFKQVFLPHSSPLI